MRFTLPTTMFVLACFACTPAAFSADEEMSENPAYKHWAAFKQGATVTQVEKIKFHVNNPEIAMHADKTIVKTTKLKLLDVDKERAIVESIVTEHHRGNDVEQAPTKLIFHAKIRKGSMRTPKEEFANLVEKDEDHDLLGKKIKCKFVESTRKNGDVTSTQKIWTSDSVPGGIVKEEKIFKRGDKVETDSTITITKFSAE